MQVGSEDFCLFFVRREDDVHGEGVVCRVLQGDVCNVKDLYAFVDQVCPADGAQPCASRSPPTMTPSVCACSAACSAFISGGAGAGSAGGSFLAPPQALSRVARLVAISSFFMVSPWVMGEGLGGLHTG